MLLRTAQQFHLNVSHFDFLHLKQKNNKSVDRGCSCNMDDSQLWSRKRKAKDFDEFETSGNLGETDMIT